VATSTPTESESFAVSLEVGEKTQLVDNIQAVWTAVSSSI